MKISLQLLRRSRTFWIVLGLAGLANLISWLRGRVTEECCETTGFPFPWIVRENPDAPADFHVLGLLLDLTVTITLALTLVWIVRALSGTD